MTQQQSSVVTYALLGSAAAMIIAAALLLTGVLDLGIDPDMLGGILVAAAVMDILLAFVFRARLGRS